MSGNNPKDSYTHTGDHEPVNAETPLPVSGNLLNGESLTLKSKAIRIAGTDESISLQQDITATGSGSKMALDVNLAQNDGADLEVFQPTHDELNLNANMQVNDTDVSSSNPIPIEGPDAVGAGLTGQPVQIGGRDLTGQVEHIAVNDLGGSIAPMITQLFDIGLVSINFASDGSVVCVGNTAHDAVDADAGEGPVKIGAHAIDYEPDSTGEQGRAKVAAADRVDIAANRRGQLITGVNSARSTLTNISTTYNDSTTTATSGAIECWNYRQLTISFEITKANTPTDITFEIEMTPDDSNYFKLMNGGLGSWIYDDTAVGSSGIERAYTFPICAYKFRVKVTATGTTASATFTVSNASYFMRN